MLWHTFFMGTMYYVHMVILSFGFCYASVFASFVFVKPLASLFNLKNFIMFFLIFTHLELQGQYSLLQCKITFGSCNPCYLYLLCALHAMNKPMEPMSGCVVYDEYLCCTRYM